MKKYTSILFLIFTTVVLTTCKKTPEIPDHTSKIELPTITTASVTNITKNTAICGGDVTNEGNDTVYARGVCWNSAGNPTLENNIGFTSDGDSLGTFISLITDLQEGSDYFIKAYARNKIGTNYGNVVQFSTIAITLPEVVTSIPINIWATSVTSGGIVIGNGNGKVTARGVCWNIDGDPTLENNIGYTFNGSGIGEFISNISDLIVNTTYYVSAYATNEKGTGYGDKLIFTTQYGFTDPRDGQVYETVIIGNQIWFTENLNYETTNSWWYDNSSANGNIYGRLYTWNASVIACPDGWHLPSDEEWKTLEIYLGMSLSDADDTGWRGTDEGKKLKSSNGWFSGGNGTNEVDFTALSGGHRTANGTFDYFSNRGYWWTSTESISVSAFYRLLTYDSDSVYRNSGNKDYGFSVRCIKD